MAGLLVIAFEPQSAAGSEADPIMHGLKGEDFMESRQKAKSYPFQCVNFLTRRENHRSSTSRLVREKKKLATCRRVIVCWGDPHFDGNFRETTRQPIIVAIPLQVLRVSPSAPSCLAALENMISSNLPSGAISLKSKFIHSS